MKLIVKTRLNERQEITMEFDGKMAEVLRGANAMMAYKGYCGLCKGKNILLQTKMAKGYCFIEFVCVDCGARAQFGQYKEGGYFLKQWEKYEPNIPKGEATQDVELDNESSPF